MGILVLFPLKYTIEMNGMPKTKDFLKCTYAFVFIGA